MKFQARNTYWLNISEFFASNLSGLWLFRLVLCLLATFGASISFAYSSKSPTLRIEVGQHTGMINRLAINQDASLLATASDDKTLRLWNLPEGTAYATLRVPIGENLQGALYAVALSPDGKTVIAAGETGNAAEKFSLYVFDVEKRILKARIADLPSATYHLAYAKNGNYFAAAFAGGYGIKIWETQSGKQVAQDTDYNERSTWLEFDNSGNLVTLSHDGYLRLYDQHFSLVKKTALHKQGVPYSVKYSPDQTQIAIGYSNLPIVDILDSQLNMLKTLEITQLNAQNTAIVAWQADSKNQPGLLVSGNLQNAQGEYVIRHWPDLNAIEQYQDIPVSKNIVTDIISLPGSANTSIDTVFASAEPSWGGLKNDHLVYKNQANLWDARLVELPKKTFHLSADGLKIAYAVDMQTDQFNSFDFNTLSINTASPPESLRDLFPATTQHEKINIAHWQRDIPIINNQTIKLDHYEKSLALAIDPVAFSALIGTNFNLRLFNVQGKEIKKITVPAEIYALNIARNGQLAVAALGDGTIRWYSLKTNEVLEELVAFFPYNQGKSWIAWTKEGFFATSDGGGHQLAGYQINKGDNKRPEWISFTQLYQAYYAPELMVPKLLRQEAILQERLKTIDTVSSRLTNHPVPTINLVEYCINPQVSTTRAFTREKPAVAETQANNFIAKLKAWLIPIRAWVLAKLYPDNATILNSPPAETAPAITQVASTPTCYSLAGQGNTRAFSRQTVKVSPAIYRNQFDHMVSSIKLRYAVQAREGGLGDIDVYVNNQIQQTKQEVATEQKPANIQEYTQDLMLTTGENRIYINAYEQSGGSSAQSTLIELLNPDSRNLLAESPEKAKIIIFSVGINTYAPPNQLEYAVKDATDFLNTVSEYKSDSYSEVVKFGLMDSEATLKNIEATFDKIAGVVNKNDTVLIYLSGHGLKEGNEYYFIPQDVDDKKLAVSALSQDKLKANMAKLAKTDHIFMFIDSCHSGAVDLAKINQDIASFDKIKQQLGENIFILAASGENQEAQDKFRLEDANPANNGLFAYAVMEGLKGKARRLDDNIIDNFNLGSYVQRRVDALTKNQSLYKQKARFQIIEVGDILTFDLTKYH